MNDKLTNNTRDNSQRLRILLSIQGGLYVAVITALLIWRHFNIPYGSGSLFVHIWTAFIFFIPVAVVLRVPIKNLRFLCSLIALSVAILIQFSMLYYHLYGISFLCFAAIWAVGWYIQTKKSSRIRQLSGTILGLLLVVIGIIVVVGQIREAWHMWLFKSLDYVQIEHINFYNEKTGVRQLVESPEELEKIVSVFDNTYPLSMGRRNLNDYDPWSVRILFKDPSRKPLVFSIGNGNDYNSTAVWVVSRRGKDYQNIPLYQVLVSEISPGLWQS